VVALGAQTPQSATIIARRDGNAWLILGHMPDSPGRPTLAELLRVLAPLQVTRV
jgi:hypothetical protein